MSELYHVYSIGNNISFKKKSYDNVNINWFVIKRKKPPIPMEEVIINYSNLSKKNRKDPEKYIKEQFTYDEALKLKKYLLKLKNLITQIEKINLPVSDTKKGYTGMKFKGGTGRYILHKEKDYKLSFKVEGIFNVDTAYESDSGDDKDTVVTLIPGELTENNEIKSED